jgi:hypothetical protein
MGLFSFFADKGSIGSTTKWAIDLFKSKPGDKDDLTHLREMINARYLSNPLDKAESFFKDKLDILFEKWGLCGVVIKILIFEAELDKNDNDLVDEMLKPLFDRMIEDQEIDFLVKFGNKLPAEFFNEEDKDLVLAHWGSDLVFVIDGEFGTYKLVPEDFFDQFKK